MMSVPAATIHLAAGRGPTHGNPGGGGVSSGPWFWIGIVFIVVVASFVAVRWFLRRQN